MIAEGVLLLIFVWLLYWIDLERKLNGRPGIPLLGTLFDSVSINVTESYGDKSIRAPVSDGSTPPVPQMPPAPPPQTRRSVKAVPPRLAPTPGANSPGTVLTEDQIQETSGTSGTSDTSTDPSRSRDKKKKKRKKKKSTASRTSKGSKNKKRTRKHKKKSGKHKKKDKEVTKESPPHEDVSQGTDSELTPDITQTETYDPAQHPKLPVPDEFNPRNPSDATAQSGETVIDEDKKT